MGASLNDLLYNFLKASLGINVSGNSAADLERLFYARYPSGVAGASEITNSYQFMSLGDSISTSEENAGGGAGYGSNWPELSCALSNQKLSYLGHAGITGQNITQIEARVDGLLAGNGDVTGLGRTKKPNYVTVLGGTNDLPQGTTTAVFKEKYTSIVTKLRTAGVRVGICAIPPRANGTYLATQTSWNTWLRGLAYSYGCDFFDFFSLLCDPVTGFYAAGNDSGDGVHPSEAAHVKMAQEVLKVANGFNNRSLQVTSNVDAGNLLVNPCLTTGGPVPGSWINQGSATTGWTETLVNDADFVGKAWRINYTALSAATTRSLTSYAVNAAVGDSLLFTCKTKIVGSNITPAAFTGLLFQSFMNGAASPVYSHVSGATAIRPVATHAFIRKVPAATANVQVSLAVVAPLAANTCDILAGQFGVFNLTQLGIA